jgi:phage tail sheath gpL-like
MGAVSFNNIPADALVPLFYAEVDPSQANYFRNDSRLFLFGQKLSSGTALAGTPILVNSTDEAIEKFGAGSMLARMHKYARLSNASSEIWVCPLSDDSAGVASTGSITVLGPATAAGTLNLYVAAQRVRVSVYTADTAASIATSLAAAINANEALPVSAAVDGVTPAKVNLTCKWKGETGNDVTLVPNYYGSIGAENYPYGVSLAVTAMSGGSGNPDVADAITAMGDEYYGSFVNPYTDAAALEALKLELGDTSGRWSPLRQKYGHVWSAKRGSLSSLVTFGATNNDQHGTVFGFETDLPNPLWENVGAWGARSARSLDNEPARPTQTLELVGLLPARPGQRFTITDRQSLYAHGVAAANHDSGVVRIDRSVTTYQKNAWNQPDQSYLDAEILFQLSFGIRYMKTRLTSKFGRHALADDGTRFGDGLAIVTPKIIRAELVAAYQELVEMGIFENAKAFEKNLIVRRNESNPNRIDVLYPPDLINQLRIFALLAQFRLQY